MSTTVRDLAPQALWNHFADLNAVPRPSKKEARVIKFIEDFGAALGLPTTTDAVGNVIIKKPATAGMEARPAVVLQSHLDMVHQKNADTVFDFDLEGIRMIVDGDWVRADGTTLGADNGIGVAAIMALLSSTDMAHPALEALFTIDEETGMTGALALEGGHFAGKYMLNLDTEDDRELTIGCAGGIDITATGNYAAAAVPNGHKGYRLTVKGLTGGHSGMDIHIGRGNANKLLTRLLFQAEQQFDVKISSFDGGSLRNAIPREAFAVVAIDATKSIDFDQFVQKEAAILHQEYQTTDSGIQVVLTEAPVPATVLPPAAQRHILRALYTVPNGIYRMSPDIKDLVQTSNNLARVLIQEGKITVLCLTRSSVDSEKIDLVRAITSAFELADLAVEANGGYPGWAPRPDSDLVRLMRNLYQERFNETPHVNACHAGLECGILGRNYPDMQMISFGPNITGAHSPDEKVQISSVAKFWGYLVETLQRV